MKSFFLTIVFGIVFLPLVTAQRAAYKPQVHQLELVVASANRVSEIGSNYANNAFAGANYLNGFRYTYHHALSHGFRAGIVRRSSDFDFPDGFGTLNEYSATKEDWDFSLGYIYKYHIAATQWYLGADVLYSTHSVAETSIVPQFPSRYSYSSYGVQAVAGMRVFFSTNFSAALELNAYYQAFPNNFGVENPLLQESESGIKGLFTLSYHFVKMKKRCTCPKMGRSRYK